MSQDRYTPHVTRQKHTHRSQDHPSVETHPQVTRPPQRRNTPTGHKTAWAYTHIHICTVFIFRPSCIFNRAMAPFNRNQKRGQNTFSHHWPCSSWATWCCRSTSSSGAAQPPGSWTGPGFPGGRRWTGSRTVGRSAAWSPGTCPETSGSPPAWCSSRSAAPAGLCDGGNKQFVLLSVTTVQLCA